MSSSTGSDHRKQPTRSCTKCKKRMPRTYFSGRYCQWCVHLRENPRRVKRVRAGFKQWNGTLALAGKRFCHQCYWVKDLDDGFYRNQSACIECHRKSIDINRPPRTGTRREPEGIPLKNRKDGAHRFRAREKGLPYENISLLAVYERDEGVCKLCKKSVDPGVLYPSGLTPSLDHVVPLSHPSSPGHLWTNVQLSHLHCNLRKGASLTIVTS